MEDKSNELETLKSQIEELEKKLELKKEIEELEKKKRELEEKLLSEENKESDGGKIQEKIENSSENTENSENDENENSKEEEYYTEEEYAQIVKKRKIIIGSIAGILLFIGIIFGVNKLTNKNDDEKLREQIEQIQKEAMEMATKDAEAKAKIEMEKKLHEEIEKIKIEEASKSVNSNEVSKTLDKLPSGKKLEELVKKAEETGKTVEELITQEKSGENSSILENVGTKINDFLGFVFDLFNNKENSEENNSSK